MTTREHQSWLNAFYAPVAVAVLLVGAVLATPTPADAADMSDAQRAAVLAEAQAAYERGMTLHESDYPAARQAFEEAAAKYQYVADAVGGDASGPLFFNLANAYLLADDPGRAIANYHRAAGRMPGDERVAANLARARATIEANRPADGPTLLDRIVTAFPPDAVIWTALLAWNVMWVSLVALVLYRARAWRWVAIPAGVVTLLAAVLMGYSWWQTPSEPRGVIVVEAAPLRSADGETFATVSDRPAARGDEFTLLESRDRWLRVAIDGGPTGWVPATDAEIIDPPDRL